MPRRGDYQHEFPSVAAQPALPARIGIRQARAPNRTGTLCDLTFDPNEFRCARLAGELADEWVDYVEISGISRQSAALGRRAIRHFCTKADLQLGPHALRASMSGQDPDIAAVLAEWERTLPAAFRAGSKAPAAFAGIVRALMVRRAQHDQRPVTPNLLRLLDGAIGVRWGSSQELDEFNRNDKRALVRAAWAWSRQLDDRLADGWASAARGRHPAEHGWTDKANLLWGLAHEQITPMEISANLPVVAHWPAQLRACIEQPGQTVYPGVAKITLVRWLVSQLYPTHVDLHAYRVLLVAATGHAPEEVTALADTDVEFLPSGVRLTLTKRRAQRVRHRTFGTAAAAQDTDEAVDFADRPHREVGAIIRRLTHVTEQARRLAPNTAGRLFVAASVTQRYELRVARWAPNKEQSGCWPAWA